MRPAGNLLMVVGFPSSTAQFPLNIILTTIVFKNDVDHSEYGIEHQSNK